MPKAIDITNQKFGHLTAKSKAESRSGKTYWLCECDCGRTKEVQTTHLKNGVTRSCGNKDCPYHNGNNIERTCPICGKVYQTNSPTRKYCFECSPDQSIVSRAEAIVIYRKAIKKRLVELRGGKCERCGYDKSLRSLQFHHRDESQKSFGLSQSDSIRSWEDCLAESEKCDLLCANCHAEEHDRLENEKRVCGGR